MENEETQLEQLNVSDTQTSENQDQFVQDPSQPGEVRFSDDEVRRAIAMSQNIASRAQEEARLAREELARLQAVKEQQQQNQPLNYAELNERMQNGQGAEAIADIASRVMDQRMQPILRESAAQKRERDLLSFVDQAIEAHPHPDFLRPGKVLLVNFVRQKLNGAEPSYAVAEMGVGAAFGMALAQNPNALNEFYNQQRTPAPITSAPNNMTPPPSQPRGGPIPHRIPTGRPAPTSQTKLTESEKKLKALLDPNNKMSDDDFQADFYAPNQSRTYDVL